MVNYNIERIEADMIAKGRYRISERGTAHSLP